MVSLRRLAVLCCCSGLAVVLALGSGRLLRRLAPQERSAPGAVRTATQPEDLRLAASAAAELCDSAARAAAAAGAAPSPAAYADEPGLLPEHGGAAPGAGPVSAGDAGALDGAAEELRRALSQLDLPEGVTLRVSHPACGEALVLSEGQAHIPARPADGAGPGTLRAEAVSELGWRAVAEAPARPIAVGRDRTAPTGTIGAAGTIAAAVSLLCALLLAVKPRGAPRVGTSAAKDERRDRLPTGSVIRLRERYRAAVGDSCAPLPKLIERTDSQILRGLISRVGERR